MGDFQYINGDRVVENGNYAQTDGCWPAVIREMSAEYEVDDDGEEYGNKVFTRLERGFDTVTARMLIREDYLTVGRRYERTGRITNLEVTVGDPVGPKGVAVEVEFFDVQAGTKIERTLYPWAQD